ncbi:hypothetical protein M413DRAFT_21758 [Hebeloma cylindrosporum]|uniref:Uncharacterized protein n=1 Tax=Hebeloma cylindrosporum TaxID=76867 RepID=A0A0C3CZH6_HEBCY|nr:hypothetical protein M413DRAFT_21758 [Hebeloma cylindrosporum h7]
MPIKKRFRTPGALWMYWFFEQNPERCFSAVPILAANELGVKESVTGSPQVTIGGADAASHSNFAPPLHEMLIDLIQSAPRFSRLGVPQQPAIKTLGNQYDW